MQIARFSDGGFVLHRIQNATHTARLSAWFDSEGALIDAEYIFTSGRTRAVKSNEVRANLARLGKVWKVKQ